MKSLKLGHRAAQEVLAGLKRSTWRLFDDKDIVVNDDVRLIDKIDSKKPATWRVIGTAHIDSIIQKRLGQIEQADYDTSERFSSPTELLKAFRHYYGPQVDVQTPVKIIRFTFTPLTEEDGPAGSQKPRTIKELKVFADGGSRGNPGPSASGFAVLDMQDRVVVKKGFYLGVTTNNQAEYQALKLGLEEALRMRADVVHIYMDSLLVVNQMLGTFKVRNRDLWPIHSAIKEIVSVFKQVSFTHVPRALNKLADAAVNEALDAELQKR